MSIEDIRKIGFVIHLWNYEFKVIPFGLTNAPATSQSLINHVFKKYLRKFAFIFFDDILVYIAILLEYLDHLQKVLLVFRHEQVFPKLFKCSFGQSQVEYLRHIIIGQYVSTDEAKI